MNSIPEDGQQATRRTAPATLVEVPSEATQRKHPLPSPAPKFNLLADPPLLLAGVIFPVFVIGLEWWTHMCAGVFFDPIPTLWHILAVAAVPLANLAVYWGVRTNPINFSPALRWANGFAVGIAAYYTLLFVPLMPLAVLALVFMGMGALPMAPLAALVSALNCWRRLRRSDLVGFHNKYQWRGMGCAVVVLMLLGWPRAITELGLQWAASESSVTKRRGDTVLRTLGSGDWMLRACYRRQGRPMDILSLLTPDWNTVTTDKARAIYYRVTGIPFNGVPPPAFSDAPTINPLADFSFDVDQGGQSVAGRLKGLSLSESRLDGSLDPDAALGYLEWTLLFKNVRDVQQEARAQIALPPGGVVSRVTLWINGEEREATFAGRGKVREAYERVVQRRRDPVLVTTQGPDKVLVQCFPVPPAGTMKVRIGITTPLALKDEKQVLLRLPHFSERNFSLPDGFNHSVWVESKQPMQVPGTSWTAEKVKEGAYAVRMQLKDPQLSNNAAALWAGRDRGFRSAWTRDPFRDDDSVILQQVEPVTQQPPRRIIIVVDGSAGMKDYYQQIAAALSRLPPGRMVSVLAAGDGVSELTQGPSYVTPATIQNVTKRLGRLHAVGGRDNTPALLHAWNLAAGSPDSAIVWIHAPQPVLLGSVEALRQRWERRPNGPRLYSVQVSPGPNLVLERLDGLSAVESVPPWGEPRGTLETLFARWDNGSPQFVLIRKSLQRSQVSRGPNTKETSAHLARLWARDRIINLTETRHLEEAVATAARYRLVTPVSGAVVLETREDYLRAGLEPAESGKIPGIPTIPEPETWVLLGLAAMLVLLTIRRGHLSCRAA